ncbi:HAD hydrolase-like protein [Streptomyces sp. 372A]
MSNNANEAIHAYLKSWELDKAVAGVFGRVPGMPASLQPHPRLLLDGTHSAAVEPGSCIFIGDAARDVKAGEAAGVDTIGCANKSGKDEVLAAAGAVIVVESMKKIADSLTHAGSLHAG